ncbi:MAG: peptidoglycan-binding protein [Alphaproteobacteria bacterium]|nr:peptidoglycan-binding protein [Alphaproteobacteria bacterium]
MAHFLSTAALAVVLVSTGCAQVQQEIHNASNGSAHDQVQKKEAQIPTCAHKIGTAAIYEPENKWWTGLGLESPEALIKIFVMRSGCFTLLDRGKGFSAVEQERDLASAGQLRGGSNMGKGQMKAADYVIVPDIVSKNANAGGSSLFALAGALVPGVGGALISGIKLTDRTADVTLTVTDVRSSEQVAMDEGHATKTDIGWGAAGGVVAGGGFGAMGAGSYESTEIGQVVTLAYLDAYTKLVTQLGGVSSNASTANKQQAVTMAREGHLFAGPSVNSKVERGLPAGMMLYPTGQKDGVWWEVTDEIGDKGWVSSKLISLAK